MLADQLGLAPEIVDEFALNNVGDADFAEGQAEDRRGGRFGVVGVDEQAQREAEDAEAEEEERKKHKAPGAFRHVPISLLDDALSGDRAQMEPLVPRLPLRRAVEVHGQGWRRLQRTPLVGFYANATAAHTQGGRDSMVNTVPELSVVSARGRVRGEG